MLMPGATVRSGILGQGKAKVLVKDERGGSQLSCLVSWCKRLQIGEAAEQYAMAGENRKGSTAISQKN